MNELSIIEIPLDPAALSRFLYARGLIHPYGDEDIGYGVHAWLKAAFGGNAPKPFRVFVKKGRPPRVLAYSGCRAEALGECLGGFADPGVYAVCHPEHMAGRTMPIFQAGRQLDFEVLCCPIARKSRTGQEKDLFLVKGDHDGPGSERLDRAQVYGDWIREQFIPAARVVDVRLEGFRLVRQTRRSSPNGRTNRKKAYLTRPHALLRGKCAVADSVGFMRFLSRGIGRHRAFGYGMVLLRPPS